MGVLPRSACIFWIFGDCNTTTTTKGSHQQTTTSQLPGNQKPTTTTTTPAAAPTTTAAPAPTTTQAQTTAAAPTTAATTQAETTAAPAPGTTAAGTTTSPPAQQTTTAAQAGGGETTSSNSDTLTTGTGAGDGSSGTTSTLVAASGSGSQTTETDGSSTAPLTESLAASLTTGTSAASTGSLAAGNGTTGATADSSPNRTPAIVAGVVVGVLLLAALAALAYRFRRSRALAPIFGRFSRGGAGGLRPYHNEKSSESLNNTLLAGGAETGGGGRFETATPLSPAPAYSTVAALPPQQQTQQTVAPPRSIFARDGAGVSRAAGEGMGMGAGFAAAAAVGATAGMASRPETATPDSRYTPESTIQPLRPAVTHTYRGAGPAGHGPNWRPYNAAAGPPRNTNTPTAMDRSGPLGRESPFGSGPTSKIPANGPQYIPYRPGVANAPRPLMPSRRPVPNQGPSKSLSPMANLHRIDTNQPVVPPANNNPRRTVSPVSPGPAKTARSSQGGASSANATFNPSPMSENPSPRSSLLVPRVPSPISPAAGGFPLYTIPPAAAAVLAKGRKNNAEASKAGASAGGAGISGRRNSGESQVSVASSAALAPDMMAWPMPPQTPTPTGSTLRLASGSRESQREKEKEKEKRASGESWEIDVVEKTDAVAQPVQWANGKTAVKIVDNPGRKADGSPRSA